MGGVGHSSAVRTRRTALGALALLTGFAPAPTQEKPPLAPPPAEAPLLPGLELESTLIYEADPKHPHLLRASIAGPEHARLWLGAKGDESATRLLRLRSGARVFGLQLANGDSVELAGPERDEALVQLEMRHALLLFEELVWKGEGTTRSAAIGSLGRLEARFASAGDARPVQIEFQDAHGARGDSFRELSWKTVDGRAVPQALEFWHAGQRIWKETVDRVQPKTFARSLFVPRELREGAAATLQWKVVPSPAPEHVARRFELPAGSDFERARKELARLRAEWTPRLAALGLKLEERGTLELDEGLRPRLVVLRLDGIPANLPEGFERISGRSAAGTLVDGFERLTPAALEALRARVPAGMTPGKPYVRWSLAAGGEHQLFLLVSWSTTR